MAGARARQPRRPRAALPSSLGRRPSPSERANDMPPRALTALPPAPEFDALPLRTPGSRLRQTQGGEGGTPSARRRAGPSDSPTSPLFFALKERLYFSLPPTLSR